MFVLSTGPGPRQLETQTQAQNFRFASAGVEREESLSSFPSDPGIATMTERDDVAAEPLDQSGRSFGNNEHADDLELGALGRQIVDRGTV